MKLYFNSKIFQKALAGLSGGFLVVFLIGHLAGNLQLFIPGELGQKQFNAYALFMTTNPAVIALSYITYTTIILHSIVTIYLVFKSKLARPIKYHVSSGNSNSTWASRNMAFLAPAAGEGEERPQGFHHYVREEEVEKQVHGDFYGH